MSVDLTPFDVCGELPTGTTLLEASAGTGKTFTIAALATRLVAEGYCELSELMLVTFSRAATQELRERVRDRLLSAYRKLASAAAARDDRDDDLVRLLARGDDAVVAARRHRLGRALSAFDAATIATTHGFCQQMLAGLGVVGDIDPDLTFVERIDDVVTEVVDDLYLRKFAPNGAPDPLIDYACARKVAFAAAVQDRHADLAPTDAAPGSAAQLRVGIAGAVRTEVQARKRSRHLIDYDDLLTRLRDALADPRTGPVAQQRIRARYRYVLVDEFQDTDPVQWEILRLAFLGATTLVLIGDPKQAIYAFRGADVLAYLAAADTATTHHTLARNWRSDSALLRAFDALFARAALGDARIVVRPVAAAHDGPRLRDAPVGAPLRLRVVTRAQFGVAQQKLPGVRDVRALVAADVTADVVRLLRSPATLSLDQGRRPVAAGDVAVLVRTNDQAELVRDALVSAGVPTVLTGTQSVFLSAVAREWLVLLRALEQPHRVGLVRAAALTSFLGWDATRLATCPEADVDELGARMRAWRDVLAERGVAALLEVISSSEQLPARMLARVSGERDLTDLRHVGQVLHEAAVSDQLGPAALAEWLQRRLEQAADDQSEDRSRRLETDADAVQVVTVHSSKGLQFPIVYVPFAWDRYLHAAPDPLRLHDDTGRRVLDVGGPGGRGYDARRVRHAEEESGEDLRLLYVAVTRARCQVVTWWAPSWNTKSSALHRLLFADRGVDGQPAESAAVPDDRQVRAHLQTWVSSAGGCVAVEEAHGSAAGAWEPAGGPVAELSAARFARSLDVAWRRASYSSLTAAAHGGGEPGVASEPEAEERQDEPRVPQPGNASGGADERLLRAVPSPMGELPTGAAFGTVVHAVLETVDTTAADLAGELRRRCDEVLAGRLAAAVDPGALADALLPVVRTPLGPLAPGTSLAAVAPADRLAELEFELPLAGGDHPRATTATLAEVAALLRRHLTPGDPLASYPDLLDSTLLGGQVLRGYLTGSIDAVLRLRPDPTRPRYLVVDYKTNWLGEFGPAGALPLTAWEYRQEALAAAMLHAHYPLQALLYCVALHRYLRWRQPSYDPDLHLGGVLYLFLRGMCGASTPVVDGAPTGVFSWRPPADLVVELSTLLDRGVA